MKQYLPFLLTVILICGIFLHKEISLSRYHNELKEAYEDLIFWRNKAIEAQAIGAELAEQCKKAQSFCEIAVKDADELRKLNRTLLKNNPP